jgi:acetolactate decarboxylase
MDGELILLNGEIYRASEKGEISSVSGDSYTPYAIVTNFKPDDSINISNPFSTGELNKFIDSKIDTNFIYAVKIEGTFTYLKTRSIPLQQKPYKKMAEVLKTQPIFESENIKGTMVGYRFPAYVNRINQPGYHFHFITFEKNSGGHVLDLKTGNVKIEFARQNSLQISFPKKEYFMGVSPN